MRGGPLRCRCCSWSLSLSPPATFPCFHCGCDLPENLRRPRQQRPRQWRRRRRERQREQEERGKSLGREAGPAVVPERHGGEVARQGEEERQGGVLEGRTGLFAGFGWFCVLKEEKEVEKGGSMDWFFFLRPNPLVFRKAPPPKSTLAEAWRDRVEEETVWHYLWSQPREPQEPGAEPGASGIAHSKFFRDFFFLLDRGKK